ncbi:MAG: hypothetical protein ACOYET_06890, partial [Bacillota bacterium]
MRIILDRVGLLSLEPTLFVCRSARSRYDGELAHLQRAEPRTAKRAASGGDHTSTPVRADAAAVAFQHLVC